MTEQPHKKCGGTIIGTWQTRYFCFKLRLKPKTKWIFLQEIKNLIIKLIKVILLPKVWVVRIALFLQFYKKNLSFKANTLIESFLRKFLFFFIAKIKKKRERNKHIFMVVVNNSILNEQQDQQ